MRDVNSAEERAELGQLFHHVIIQFKLLAEGQCLVSIDFICAEPGLVGWPTLFPNKLICWSFFSQQCQACHGQLSVVVTDQQLVPLVLASKEPVVEVDCLLLVVQGDWQLSDAGCVGSVNFFQLILNTNNFNYWNKIQVRPESITLT